MATPEEEKKKEFDFTKPPLSERVEPITPSTPAQDRQDAAREALHTLRAQYVKDRPVQSPGTVHATEEDAIQASIDADATTAQEPLIGRETGTRDRITGQPNRRAPTDHEAAARSGILAGHRGSPAYKEVYKTVFSDPDIAAGMTLQEADALVEDEQARVADLGWWESEELAVKSLAQAEAMQALLQEQARRERRGIQEVDLVE